MMMASVIGLPFIWSLQIMPSLKNNSPISKSRGVVLPTVLWVSILTIIIAINYASTVQLNTRAVDNIKLAMMLKYDSTSGIYIALDRLLSDPSTADSKYSLSVNNKTVDIEVRSENMKTNLNAADARQLRRSFLEAGVDPEMAEILSDRVIDWRDPDHEARQYGMEDDEYFNSGKDYGAKDRRFDDLAEILLIAELDANRFRLLSDYFTTYSKSAGKLYTLTATAKSVSGKQSYVINTTIQLTYQPVKPYRILKWQYNHS